MARSPLSQAAKVRSILARLSDRMTQPEAMKTRDYVYGVEKLNGFDAWSLFTACAAGNLTKARALLTKDQGLANAQFWYQFPIHMAVRGGNDDVVKLLLDHGADPGQSRFTYDSWNKLLRIASDREYGSTERLLQRAMKKKFAYDPDFDALKEAIVAGNSRRIQAVLKERPELARASDALGNNAIHWSVITRQRELIECFIDWGTPIDAQRADGQTPLLLAISQAYDYWYRGTRNKRHPTIRNVWVIAGELLARGAAYTISAAAALGDLRRIEQLLRRDPTLAFRLDSARVSPLSYAAREGYAHIVEHLLQHGADPNVPEDLAPNGRALFEACGGNHYEIAELLLAHGADPNAGVDSCGCCLTIAEFHHGKAARPLQALLRKHGAYTPPYAMNAKQLERAIRSGDQVTQHEELLACVLAKKNTKLLDLLLEVDPSVPSRMQYHGGIAYPCSAANMRTLLAHGLDPNRPDWLGKTFLHACAEHAHQSAAEILLGAGADVNARDIEFLGTPMAAAVRHEVPREVEELPKLLERKKQMVEFLLKRGAATNLPGDEHWSTPLAWARKRGLAEIEAILIAHGATA